MKDIPKSPTLCYYASLELRFFPQNQTYIFSSSFKLNTSSQLWKTSGHGKQLTVILFTVIFHILEIPYDVLHLYPLLFSLNKGSSFNLPLKGDIFKSSVIHVIDVAFQLLTCSS